MNHGPTLVDNNVLVGQPVRSNSEATIFAHNLFVDCGYDYHPDVNRRSQYFAPHTTKAVGSKTGTAQDEKWFNNIFIRRGLERVKDAPGFVSDDNAFLEGAKPSRFGDKNSVVDPHVTQLSIEDQPRGVTITFSVNDVAPGVRGSRVDADLVGVFPTVGQTIEDRFGNPITIETDIAGEELSQALPGPLANLRPGENRITWSLTKE